MKALRKVGAPVLAMLIVSQLPALAKDFSSSNRLAPGPKSGIEWPVESSLKKSTSNSVYYPATPVPVTQDLQLPPDKPRLVVKREPRRYRSFGKSMIERPLETKITDPFAQPTARQFDRTRLAPVKKVMWKEVLFPSVDRSAPRHQMPARQPLPAPKPMTYTALESVGSKPTVVSKSKCKPGDINWHSNFEDACKASILSGKPVLLFQMMGNLDDKFC